MILNLALDSDLSWVGINRVSVLRGRAEVDFSGFLPGNQANSTIIRAGYFSL
jgi:hypothetical protein